MPQDIALGVSNQSVLFVVRFMFELDVTLFDIESVDVFEVPCFFIQFQSAFLDAVAVVM